MPLRSIEMIVSAFTRPVTPSRSSRRFNILILVGVMLFIHVFNNFRSFDIDELWFLVHEPSGVVDVPGLLAGSSLADHRAEFPVHECLVVVDVYTLEPFGFIHGYLRWWHVREGAHAPVVYFCVVWFCSPLHGADLHGTAA